MPMTSGIWTHPCQTHCQIIDEHAANNRKTCSAEFRVIILDVQYKVTRKKTPQHYKLSALGYLFLNVFRAPVDLLAMFFPRNCSAVTYFFGLTCWPVQMAAFPALPLSSREHLIPDKSLVNKRNWKQLRNVCLDGVFSISILYCFIITLPSIYFENKSLWLYPDFLLPANS